MRAWKPTPVFLPGEWTEEPGGLQFIGPQRVGHNWSDWGRTHQEVRVALAYSTRGPWDPGSLPDRCLTWSRCSWENGLHLCVLKLDDEWLFVCTGEGSSTFQKFGFQVWSNETPSWSPRDVPFSIANGIWLNLFGKIYEINFLGVEQIELLIWKILDIINSDIWSLWRPKPWPSVLKLQHQVTRRAFKTQIVGGYPWWSSGWESTSQHKGHKFDPCSGKIPYASEQLSPFATTTEPVL